MSQHQGNSRTEALRRLTLRQQQGSGALGMVVLILLLGGALLHATRQQLDAALTMVAQERQHIIDYYAAQAALEWGSQLSWPDSSGWQCQTETQQQWRVCLQRNDPLRILLRGEHLAQPLALWQWVEPDGQRLRPLAHGWIDFCPLTHDADCLPDDA
ncbi:DUF2509 family protein [Erwinia sp. V71]|uniref:DUF2509 family protein n=1 Tax=Erwinia sp. V71 TaxID=3369424 RepID=UPI003F5DA47F